MHFGLQVFIIKINSKDCKSDMENHIHLVYHIFITFFMPKNSNYSVLCIHTFCCLLFNSPCFPTHLLFILQMLSCLFQFNPLYSHFFISVPQFGERPFCFSHLHPAISAPFLLPNLQFVVPFPLRLSWEAAESTVMMQAWYNLQSIPLCHPLLPLPNNFNSTPSMCHCHFSLLPNSDKIHPLHRLYC